MPFSKRNIDKTIQSHVWTTRVHESIIYASEKHLFTSCLATKLPKHSKLSLEYSRTISDVYTATKRNFMFTSPTPSNTRQASADCKNPKAKKQMENRKRQKINFRNGQSAKKNWNSTETSVWPSTQKKKKEKNSVFSSFQKSAKTLKIVLI